jgi:TfuA protein
MRAAVFIDRTTAAAALTAEFLPPVERGDIDRLLDRERPPEVIGIVDGKFLQALSVSPKEVLRAVECEPWGDGRGRPHLRRVPVRPERRWSAA